MSKRKSIAETLAIVDPDEELSGDTFKFIDLSNINDPDLRRKNRAKVRSHVVKVARKRERDDREKQGMILQWPTDGVVMSANAEAQAKMFFATSSPWSHPSGEIIPGMASSSEWSTPLARTMIHHVIDAVISVNCPTVSGKHPSPTAIQAWKTFCSSRMVIHASIYASTAHRDAYNPMASLSTSRDALTHRGEALRLINEEIAGFDKGQRPSETLLFAVMAMTADPFGPSIDPSETDIPTIRPFRLSKAAQGWQQLFLRIRHSKIHHDGLFLLVDMAGGLNSLQDRGVAKMISHHDVLIAVQELRAPKQPYVQLPELADLVANLSLEDQKPESKSHQTSISNLEIEWKPEPSPEPYTHEAWCPGSSMPALKHSLGESTPLSVLLTHLQRVIATEELLARGPLPGRDPKASMLGHSADKDALHHAILSVPSQPELNEKGSLYEPVRLVALAFEVGILFPLPLSFGALTRVVRWMKAAFMEIGDLKQIEMTEALIWILFVGGVAALGIPERDWFVEKLAVAVERNGMTRWTELKLLLRSFIWMDEAMDEGAMNLWDDIRFYLMTARK